MDLGPYVDELQQRLSAAAEAGGDEARALAERLAPPLEAAIRLTLQDALSAAAAEITYELAPGSVELRLRGRDLEFVVTRPPDDGAEPDPSVADDEGAGRTPLGPVAEGDDGGVARINLRMPEPLKARVERAAAAEGMSVNTWLVRVAGVAVERSGPWGRRDRRAAPGSQRYTGWAR